MNARLAKSLVLGATIAWTPLGVVSILPAMFSVMMFDAPGSEKNLATIALAASLMSLPVVCGIAVAMSWQSLRAASHAVACLWAMLPFVNLFVGGAGLNWIMWMQGGKFNG